MATYNYNDIIREHQEALYSGSSLGATQEFLNLRPFWSVVNDEVPSSVKSNEKVSEEDKESQILEWLEDHLSILMEEGVSRAYTKINNHNFYNAATVLANRGARAVDRNGRPISEGGLFVINHARDLVKQSVSALMRFRPQVGVTPVNSEYSDRLGARFSKRVIDNLFYINDVRAVCERLALESKIAGESYIFVEYDPSAGDLDPTYQRIMEFKAQAEASGIGLDYFKKKNGSEVFVDAESGEEYDISLIRRTGEVVWKQPLSHFVLTQPQEHWRDVEYIFYGEFKHIDEISAQYQVSIEPNSDGYRDWSQTFAQFGDYAVEWTFYHRGRQFLDKGYYAKFVEGTLLSHGPLPFSHRQLPVVRLTDIDDICNSHGVSFFDDIRPPLVLKNRLMNFMYRNISLVGAPKLAVAEGSANPYAMSSGPFIVPYSAGQPPHVLQFNSFGPEVFTFSEKVLSEAQQIGGVFGISRGEVPNNARAASILNFYEEQESQREATNIEKYNAAVEKLARLSLGTAGDNYQPEDERTVRVVGRNNKWRVKKVTDTTKLSSPYDIKVERTTALSESKQGRIEQIVQLSQLSLSDSGAPAAQGIFTKEQILHMLDLADSPTFFEMATAAVEKAESENEDMFEGEMVEAPLDFEAHIVHWNVHFQFMQSREFSDGGLPEEIVGAFVEHLMTTEALMYERATQSLSFATGLMDNPYFPSVFDITGKPTIAQLIMMHQQPPMTPEEGPPETEAGSREEQPAEPVSSPTATSADPNDPDALPVEDGPETPDRMPVTRMIRLMDDPNNPGQRIAEVITE